MQPVFDERNNTMNRRTLSDGISAEHGIPSNNHFAIDIVMERSLEARPSGTQKTHGMHRRLTALAPSGLIGAYLSQGT